MKQVMITISREYGSGGHDIGKALAERLGIPFYDNELIAMAAKDSGHQEATFAQAETEHTSSLGMTLSKLTGGRMPLNNQLFMIQHSMIRTIADAGSAVIVGRCADRVLKDYAPCVNFFVQASLPNRIQTVMNRDHITRSEAENRIAGYDKSRATYYNYYTDEKWGDRVNYDMVISSDIGTEPVVDILESFIRHKYPELKAE